MCDVYNVHWRGSAKENGEKIWMVEQDLSQYSTYCLELWPIQSWLCIYLVIFLSSIWRWRQYPMVLSTGRSVKLEAEHVCASEEWVMQFWNSLTKLNNCSTNCKCGAIFCRVQKLPECHPMMPQQLWSVCCWNSWEPSSTGGNLTFVTLNIPWNEWIIYNTYNTCI